MSFPCPRCKGDTACRDTRMTKRTVGIRRRRLCPKCSHNFATVEIMVDDFDLYQQITKNLAVLKALLRE